MSIHRFEWDAFRTWALADYDKAAASVYYYSSRIRAMVKLGLDLDACMADPRTLWRQGNAVIADSKTQRRGCHTIRNFQRALNWLSDYGRHLELDDLRYVHRGLADEDLEDRVRRWRRWPLSDEPKALPKTVDMPDLGALRTYVHAKCTPFCRRHQPVGRAHCYTTYLRRAIADVALAGNFRRGEMPQIQVSGLAPHVGQIHLRHAMKGSLSGDVEVPWSLFWPDSGLMQYLQVRVPVDGTDQLFTAPTERLDRNAAALTAAEIYKHLRRMGDELGVPLNLVRTKRRALSDIDETGADVRVTQAKGRHVKVENTITYVGRVTSSRQRRELAERGVPGYAVQDAARAVGLDGRPLFRPALPAGVLVAGNLAGESALGGMVNADDGSLECGGLAEAPGGERISNVPSVEGSRRTAGPPIALPTVVVDGQAGAFSMLDGHPRRELPVLVPVEGLRIHEHRPVGVALPGPVLHAAGQNYDAEQSGTPQGTTDDHGRPNFSWAESASCCLLCRRPLPPQGSQTGPQSFTTRPDFSNMSSLAGPGASFPPPAERSLQPMPTTIVKKGSLQPAQKPVTDMTFGLEVDANVVPGAPVAADAPRRAARMGGAREPSDSSSTAAPTTVRREGTFARISRVAPDGAKPTGVLSAHPATRAATREEMAVPRRASSSSLRSKRNGGD